MVLSISGGGALFGWLSGIWQDLGRERLGRGIEVELHQNIPNSLGICMPGAEVELPSEQKLVFISLSFLGGGVGIPSRVLQMATSNLTEE